MYKYVIKRLLLLIPVLLGVVFIVFFIMNLTPGDPGRMILGVGATQSQVDRLDEQLGYNNPYFVRFFNYVKDIVTKFDFGTSYATQKPVIDQILVKFPYTLRLSLWAVFFSSVFGIVLGVTAAVKEHSIADSSITVFAVITSVMPSYWVGMLMILLFAITLGILPAGGASTPLHFVLPVATLALCSLGPTMRLTRSVMLESLRQDFIRTARSKGVAERVVIYQHALRNALLPLITRIGIQLASLMGGSVICETVFNIPGVGAYIVTAIRSKDIPAVMTCTLFFAFLYCLIMLAMDILYAYIDPRTRARYVKG